MAEYRYELKIPKQRVAVLVGKNGSVKKHLEEITNTKINVDSKEGDVFITGEDNLKIFTVQTIIKAIGRGFNPEKAELLLKTDYTFEVLSIHDYAKNQADIIRLRGRVIGREGKSRNKIEELTDCYLSVFGKTIGVIGLAEKTAVAKRAIENLLRGSPHSKVYHWLEQKRAELKKEEMLDLYRK